VSVEVPTRTALPARSRWAERRSRRAAASSGWARAGFVARGLIYGIIGILAIKLAVGAGGKTTNQQGALETVARQAVRQGAADRGRDRPRRLCTLAAPPGLARTRPEDSDTTFERVAAFASGIVYAGLCAVAVEILLGSGSSSSGNAQKTAAGVFGWPAGTWLVGIAGAC